MRKAILATLNETAVVQLSLFSDDLTDAVYRRRPYVSRGTRYTRNANDSIFVNGGARGLLAVTKSGSGYTGKIVMGVMAA